MKHRLTRQLLLCFTVILIVFACTVGSSFGYFFLRYTESHHLEDLRKLALSIAAYMRENPQAAVLTDGQEIFPADARRKKTRMRHGHGMMRRASANVENHEENPSVPEHSMYCRRFFPVGSCNGDLPETTSSGPADTSIGRYLKHLNDLSQCEVWVMDARTQNFSLYGESDHVQYDEFPPEAEEVIQQALQGETVISRDFTPLLATPSVTVGTPLYAEDGSLRGILLLHRTLTALRDAQQQALLIFVLCLAAALTAAALISFLLARRFLRPLRRMENFAEDLAAGNYGSRSGITQDDEIGSLAKSLDTLSLRLEETSRQKARLDKMRQDFLSNISHELRTPITVLRGTLELLSSGMVKDEEKRQGCLEQMTRNVLGMQRLVQDLFELARLQNTDFAVEKSELNLMDALEDALQAARQMASKKEIEISLSPATPLLMFCGDYGRLRQMFLTVLDNAVKFSPVKGRITVQVRMERKAWAISIRDGGEGIPSEDLPHIFDRFHSRRRTENREGTGLGLPIAREIARRHDIEILCESTEGEGTVFTFSASLPQKATEQEKQEP